MAVEMLGKNARTSVAAHTDAWRQAYAMATANVAGGLADAPYGSEVYEEARGSDDAQEKMIALAAGMMIRVVLDVPKGASAPHMLQAYMKMFGENVEPENVITGRRDGPILARLMPAFGSAIELP